LLITKFTLSAFNFLPDTENSVGITSCKFSDTAKGFLDIFSPSTLNPALLYQSANFFLLKPFLPNGSITPSITAPSSSAILIISLSASEA
jgi:hypothetical protein